MEKPPFVAHNWPPIFFSIANRPKTSPNLIFCSIKMSLLLYNDFVSSSMYVLGMCCSYQMWAEFKKRGASKFYCPWNLFFVVHVLDCTWTTQFKLRSPRLSMYIVLTNKEFRGSVWKGPHERRSSSLLTNALSFYRSQNVLCRSKFFVSDQKFIYILCRSQTFCAIQKDDLHSVKLFFVPAQKFLKRH